MRSSGVIPFDAFIGGFVHGDLIHDQTCVIVVPYEMTLVLCAVDFNITVVFTALFYKRLGALQAQLGKLERKSAPVSDRPSTSHDNVNDIETQTQNQSQATSNINSPRTTSSMSSSRPLAKSKPLSTNSSSSMSARPDRNAVYVDLIRRHLILTVFAVLLGMIAMILLCIAQFPSVSDNYDFRLAASWAAATDMQLVSLAIFIVTRKQEAKDAASSSTVRDSQEGKDSSAVALTKHAGVNMNASSNYTPADQPHQQHHLISPISTAAPVSSSTDKDTGGTSSSPKNFV